MLDTVKQEAIGHVHIYSQPRKPRRLRGGRRLHTQISYCGRRARQERASCEEV